MIRRRRRIAGGALAVVVLGWLFVSSVRTDGIPENVRIGGVDVGDLGLEAARARLQPIITQRLRRNITFRSSDDASLSITLPGSSISSGAQLDEALEAARTSRGRIGRLLSRFGIASQRDIPLRFAISGNAIDAVVDTAEGNLGSRPIAANVVKEGTQLVVVKSREGRSVDRATLVARTRELPAQVQVPVRVVTPAISDATAQRAKDLAEQMRARPREVTYRQATVILNPATVTKALTFTARGNELLADLDPKVLRAALAKPLGIVERAPQNAKWRLGATRAILLASRPGNRLDADALTSAIRTNPQATTIAATIVNEQPERTTEKARALKIREKVSEFTTPYDCCQNRVVNIGVAARVIDGTILQPGERFSLNDRLGERTAARGFVEAPAIEGGELKPSIGGGVSQVATTLYNAAYFGGLELIDHTPHSFYISRYPKGREATVSWRTPDLVFRNNWDAAVLIDVTTARNAITVRMYSSKLGRRVETSATEPSNIVETKTITRFKPELPPGTKKIVQGKGFVGFTITNRRKVYRDDEVISDTSFSWTYRPENEIVEVGPDLPKDQTDTGTSTATTTTPATPGGTTTGSGTSTAKSP